MNPQRKRPPRAPATSRSKSRSRHQQLASLEASGDKAAREGRNIDALRAYDAIVGLKGATASVWNKIGDRLSLVGEFAQAIGAFERALELDATIPATHHNLARALFALGDVDRSLGLLRRASILTVPDVVTPPCLTTGRFTFGSLVSLYKITPPVFDAWSEILKKSNGSQLVLANADLKSPHNRNYVQDQFQSRGVAADQLRFLPPADHEAFLKYYDQIDLALDAFPYNGGTTTMEAIWQGVPVLTKEGDRWAARTSQSLLCECHLSDFVARDLAGYIDQAVGWATNKPAWQKLSTLRSTMRARLQASSVCDCELLTREMEKIYLSCIRSSSVPVSTCD